MLFTRVKFVEGFFIRFAEKNVQRPFISNLFYNQHKQRF